MKKYTVYGFVILPIFITSLCYLITMFAPDPAKAPNPNLIVMDLLKLFSDQNTLSAHWHKV